MVADVNKPLSFENSDFALVGKSELRRPAHMTDAERSLIHSSNYNNDEETGKGGNEKPKPKPKPKPEPKPTTQPVATPFPTSPTMNIPNEPTLLPLAPTISVPHPTESPLVTFGRKLEPEYVAKTTTTVSSTTIINGKDPKDFEEIYHVEDIEDIDETPKPGERESVDHHLRRVHHNKKKRRCFQDGYPVACK